MLPFPPTNEKWKKREENSEKQVAYLLTSYGYQEWRRYSIGAQWYILSQNELRVSFVCPEIESKHGFGRYNAHRMMGVIYYFVKDTTISVRFDRNFGVCE